MTNEISQKGVPVWIKIAIAVVAVWITGFAVLIFVGGKWLTDKVSSRENAVEVVQKIVQIPQPLPKDWQFGAGMDMGPMKFAVMLNKKDKTTISLTRYPGSKQQESTKIGAEQGAGMVVEERGTETIAGHQMTYTRGHSSRSPMAMQIGFVTADNGDLVMIHVVEPSLQKFDPSLSKAVLTSIKSIH